MEKKNESKAMSLIVTDGLTVTVHPNANHEFLMPTKEVATGYGVSPHTVRFHLSNNPTDFLEGKHFIKGVGISNTLGKNAQPHQVYYTKRGVVRLGFFIKSDRARMFRDWAEDLIIHQLEQFSPELSGADKPPYTNQILYEFDTRVRTKIVNGETYFKVRDISLLCRVPNTSNIMQKLPNLNNYIKITADFWDVAEWWCNKDGVRQFLRTTKNPNFLRLHDALFSPQLSLMSGGR